LALFRAAQLQLFCIAFNFLLAAQPLRTGSLAASDLLARGLRLSWRASATPARRLYLGFGTATRLNGIDHQIGLQIMNVFELDQALVNDYERFARSFTLIRAPDIQQQVGGLYASDRFWPEPLVSINPRFERGETINRLVANGTLHSATGSIFSIDGEPLSLYRHQAQAVAKAATNQSYVVTTGTGSGKSLCFFIPIIDAAVRARATGEAQRTRAVIIYPMNALANSQREEIDKFIKQSGLPDHLRPTFARYTGQENAEERERIREAKPDILLTNFMMLELLMTRQNALDRAVIANAHGLEYLVLDELHTYRGRQGADVAMLVRRVRDRLCPEKTPVCIGTSATMATEGDDAKRATVR
jgi:ATP-dependent helicase YprA (DUF1998 family)